MKTFSLNSISFLIFCLCSFAILLFFHVRGFAYFDEGYILNSALRIVHGEVTYRDFDMVYTPLSFTFTSIFLFIFGESVFAGRLAALTIAVVSLFAIFQITRLFTKNIWLIMPTLLFYIAWGPTHVNFPWPTMFALCFLLYAGYFYMSGAINNSSKYFFFSGICTMLVFLSKQNFGGGAFLILFFIFFFLPTRDARTHMFRYLSGFFLIFSGYILYLFTTSSLMGFIENMYLYTIQRVFIDKSLETPFLYEGAFITRVLKGIFYTLPLLIALTALRYVPKHKGILLLIPMLTIMFYLLGIRPTTDYVHVVPLFAIASLPLALIIVYAKNRIFRLTVMLVMVALIILGFYTAYYKGYQQWMPPLKDSTAFAPSDRMKIFLTPTEQQQSDAIISYIQTNTKQNEYIFVNGYWPLVYFISDRRNATPYDLVSPNQLPLTYQLRIIRLLNEKNVNVVVENEINKKDDSIVTQYIRQNYDVEETIGGFMLMKKRNTEVFVKHN